MKHKKKMPAKTRRKLGLPLHLSLSPQHITADAWYYEEKTGLHLRYGTDGPWQGVDGAPSHKGFTPTPCKSC